MRIQEDTDENKKYAKEEADKWNKTELVNQGGEKSFSGIKRS